MQNLQRTATEYFALGLNVLPVKAKRPLVTWQRWQTERQTHDEFDALPFSQADGLAVITGTKADNGRYFLAVDVDTGTFRQTLLPITQTERTPRGGLHLYYYSHTNARGEKHPAPKLELLGAGNLVVVAPTPGYLRLNDNNPTELFSLKARFDRLLVQLGGRPNDALKAPSQPMALPRKAMPLGSREEEAIVRFLCRHWREGNRNQLCMYFCGFCLKAGVPMAAALRIISHVVDRMADPEKAARLAQVRYHYEHRTHIPLKGKSGLKEIVRAHHGH